MHRSTQIPQNDKRPCVSCAAEMERREGRRLTGTASWPLVTAGLAIRFLHHASPFRVRIYCTFNIYVFNFKFQGVCLRLKPCRTRRHLNTGKCKKSTNSHYRTLIIQTCRSRSLLHALLECISASPNM